MRTIEETPPPKPGPVSFSLVYHDDAVTLQLDNGQSSLELTTTQARKLGEQLIKGHGLRSEADTCKGSARPAPTSPPPRGEKKAITEYEALILKLLNAAVKADAAAIGKLVDHRVPCNDKLADHPTIQCGVVSTPESSDRPVVGMLGLINGILGEFYQWNGDPLRMVCAVIDDDDGKLLRFEFLQWPKEGF